MYAFIVMNLADQHEWTYILSVDYRYNKERDRLLDLLLPRGIKLYSNCSFFIEGKGQYLPREAYNQISPPVPLGYRDGPNSYAHFCAFRNIIKQAGDMGVENILIIEDDLILTKDFDEIALQAWEQLPDDWDMLYYGANHSTARTQDIGSHLMRVCGSLTTHMVAFKSTIYSDITSLPIDKTIDWNIAHRLHDKFKCYAVWPSIARQKPGYSLIWGQRVDYSELWERKGIQM